MLRTLGVPARVVSGLAYGVRSGSTRLITAADAHAWVEVYYPGVGWSPMDPTVGVALAPPSVSHRSLFSRVMTAVEQALPGGRLALGVLSALLITLSVGLVRLLRGGALRRQRRDGENPPGPVLAAFLRLSQDPRGPAPRAGQETAREYFGRVDLPSAARPALATLEQEMYGATPPDEDATGRAVAALDALHPAEERHRFAMPKGK
jgi:hypothetical protein